MFIVEALLLGLEGGGWFEYFNSSHCPSYPFTNYIAARSVDVSLAAGCERMRGRRNSLATFSLGRLSKLANTKLQSLWWSAPPRSSPPLPRAMPIKLGRRPKRLYSRRATRKSTSSHPAVRSADYSLSCSENNLVWEAKPFYRKATVGAGKPRFKSSK